MGAEVRVLGPLEVVGEGGPVVLPGRKHRRLLGALVLAEGRVCSLDALVDAVWGESAPVSARKLLQLYVSQLRKVLPAGAAVVTKESGYALELERGSIDAVRFERLAHEAASALAGGNPALAASLTERALGLWRGAAYADVLYEDFARAEVERLEELRLGAVEDRLDAQLRLGHHEGVLPEALALAAQHTHRERLQALAMLTLFRSGRQTEALDLYTEVRRRLDDELGLEPGIELRELQRRILQQDASLDLAATPTEWSEALPVPPTPLVGREAELESLREILARREIRLLVLTGAGGSGKTRLALEAVREVASTYANGAVLVELAPLRDPELVLPTIAQRLDVSAAYGEELLDTLVNAVHGRELLLVLDNAEHLREAAPLFAELVARVPRLTLLVTSRAVLHVSGEHVFPVEPLGVDAAAELFEARARALDPTHVQTPDTDRDVREICRRVDGLPLALELAAARVRSLGVRALRERLDVRLPLLGGGPRDLPARQQTLGDTIDWSAKLLTDAQRHVFARLAVFRGGATLDAAESACVADVDTLEELVDNHLLLRRLDHTGMPRFGMLETIREYALKLLGDERPHAERAMVTSLVELAREADFGAGHVEWRARFDAEIDNIRAAADESAGLDPLLELELVGLSWRYWLVHGPLTEGLARIEAVLERAPREPSVQRAHALSGAAGLAWSAGDVDRARALAEEGLAVAGAVGGLAEERTARTVLGILANAEGDRAATMAHTARSAEISELLGEEPLLEKINMAAFARDAGDPASAAELARDVLESHRVVGNFEGIGYAAITLGLASCDLGDNASARSHFEEAYNAFTAMGFRVPAGHGLQGLAAVEARAERFVEAANWLGKASVLLDADDWSAETFDPRLVAEAETAARTALGDTAFEEAFAAGRAPIRAYSSELGNRRSKSDAHTSPDS